MSSPVVLCIDDRADFLKIRKAALEKCGYSVETATNASTAIRKLQTSQVAAVLLDYRNEGIDSQAVAYHIKQRFPNEPVILLSAYSCTPEALLWLVDEYVMKSEPIESLAQVIDRVTAVSMKKTKTYTQGSNSLAATA